MDTQGQLQTWRKRLQGFAQSGLSVRQWCQRQGISMNQYYYWRRQLASVAEKAPDPRWLAVGRLQETPLPSTPGGVRVRIAGATIDLEPGFDPDLLRAIVRALAAERC